MAKRIRMIQGSSVAEDTFAEVRRHAEGKRRVLVMLDSNHTHEHVLRELELYSPLVRADSYLVVFDTIIGEMPADFSQDRPWGPDDNPLTAVQEFLRKNNRFEVDREFDNKLLITVAPGGYLRCVKD
jgi:cephalosporin hydroxylase